YVVADPGAGAGVVGRARRRGVGRESTDRVPVVATIERRGSVVPAAPDWPADLGEEGRGDPGVAAGRLAGVADRGLPPSGALDGVGRARATRPQSTAPDPAVRAGAPLRTPARRRARPSRHEATRTHRDARPPHSWGPLAETRRAGVGNGA